MKKILSVLLAAVMLLSVGVAAFAFTVALRFGIVNESTSEPSFMFIPILPSATSVVNTALFLIM